MSGVGLTASRFEGQNCGKNRSTMRKLSLLGPNPMDTSSDGQAYHDLAGAQIGRGALTGCTGGTKRPLRASLTGFGATVADPAVPGAMRLRLRQCGQ